MCVGGGAGLPQLLLSQVQCPPPFAGGTAMSTGALVRISSAGHRNDGERGIVMSGEWTCLRLWSGQKVFVRSDAVVRTDDPGEEVGWLGERTFISKIDLTNVQHMV